MATENLIPISTFANEDDAPGAVRSGVVRAFVDGSWLVSHDRGSVVAKLAPSCLLAPEVNDVVMLATVPEGAFVLAVLDRGGEHRRIEVDGELHLSATRVCIEADEELTLRSKRVARLVGEALTVAATEATWVAKQLRVLGEAFVVDATRIKQISTYSDVESESARERLGNSYRDVREVEHVKAGSLTFSLRDTLSVHANLAAVTAKKLLRLAGDQIHLG